MAPLIRTIDLINEHVGRLVAWCAILMVVIQFVVVILRYVFAIGFIPMQEAIWYLHGMLFMLGAGYTLLRDGHVRIDILYREATPQRKAWVDLCGAIFLLGPVLVTAFYLAWPYVLNSWRVREGSTEVSGLPFIYLLKSVIVVALALLAIQGISVALKSILTLTGRAEEIPHVSEEVEVL